MLCRYKISCEESEEECVTSLAIVEEEGNDTVQCHHDSLYMEPWKTLYCKQDLSDVTLIVGKEKLKAHRLVLAAHSDVVKGMLYGDLKEGKEEVITLQGTDGVSFRSLLEYCYTGCVTLNKSFICQLIELSEYYNMQYLKQVCCNWLWRHLCVDDVCQYLMFAEPVDQELYKNCLAWLDDHIADVTETEGFTQLLTEEHLEAILARDTLDIQEINLFESLERWVEYDCAGKRAAGVALAQQIRLPTMTPAQLLGKVQCGVLVVDMPEVMKALKLLQQPDSTNPYEEGSPATVLRLPRIPSSQNQYLQWSKLDNPVSDKVEFSRPNLATIEATACNTDITLLTTEIQVPSSVRVQVISKSSASYKEIDVGFEISKKSLSGTFPFGQLQDADHHVNGAVVSNSVAKLGMSRRFTVSVGCAVYISLHITGQSLCTQVNETRIVQNSLGKASEEANKKSKYTLRVRVINPTERITIAIREDTCPCCNQ